jgi:hypothetical protein
MGVNQLGATPHIKGMVSQFNPLAMQKHSAQLLIIYALFGFGSLAQAAVPTLVTPESTQQQTPMPPQDPMAAARQAVALCQSLGGVLNPESLNCDIVHSREVAQYFVDTFDSKLHGKESKAWEAALKVRGFSSGDFRHWTHDDYVNMRNKAPGIYTGLKDILSASLTGGPAAKSEAEAALLMIAKPGETVNDIKIRLNETFTYVDTK